MMNNTFFRSVFMNLLSILIVIQEYLLQDTYVSRLSMYRTVVYTPIMI